MLLVRKIKKEKRKERENYWFTHQLSSIFLSMYIILIEQWPTNFQMMCYLFFILLKLHIGLNRPRTTHFYLCLYFLKSKLI